jgi:DNA-binding beta-propeller fold protein YncE
LFVADVENHRIQAFTLDGKFLYKWGTVGNASGEMRSPCGVAVDDAGSIYVADTYNNRVQKFSRAVHVELRSWADIKTLYLGGR